MFIYLDHNATSPIDPDILEILIKSHKDYFANPSSIHAAGRKAKASYLKAKDLIAKYFKVSSLEIFFTSSATEALNWLLKTKPYKHIITSDLEHAAIYNTCKALEKKGTKVTFLHPGINGCVDEKMVHEAICPETDLIILGAANSETGIIQKTDGISKLAKEKNIPFYVDAVGLIGRGEFEIDKDVTAYVISSHKIYGPKGIACIVHKNPSMLSTLFEGGYQESSKRAGTENLPAAIAFAHAFEKIMQNQDELKQIKAIRDHFEDELKKRFGATIIGENTSRVHNTSSAIFDGLSAETLLQLLDQNGIYASHGSACSSGAIEPSRVLINMDLGVIKAKESIRFSLSKFTNYKDIETTLVVLESLIKQLLSYA